MSQILPPPLPSPAHKVVANKHCQSVHTDDDAQPWTAARCNRLLRQLQSRLAVLRKLTSKEQSQPPSRPKRQHADAPADAQRKRVRVTYSQRKSKFAANGKIETPPRQTRTLKSFKPILASSPCGMLNLASPQCPPPTKHLIEKPLSKRAIGSLSTSPELSKQLQYLKWSLEPEHYRAYEGIFELVNGLLRTTQPKKRDVHKKSLLGMCLRKVPDCMAEIEAWDREALWLKGLESTWNPATASQEMYDQLEAFGGTSSEWRPLKVAICSHVVWILSEEVRQGIFESEFVQVLVDLYLYHNRSDDAARIAASAADPSMTTDTNTPVHIEHLEPLLRILKLPNSRQIAQPVLQRSVSLIQQDGFPTAHLSTPEFALLWKLAIKSLLEPSYCGSSMEFIRTAMAKLLDPEYTDDTMELTFIDVVAGLVSVAMKSSNGSQRRALQIFDTCTYEAEELCSINTNDITFILALARIISLEDDGSDSFFQAELDFANIVEPHRDESQRRMAVLLLSSISRYRSRSETTAGHQRMEHICSKLAQLALPAWFMKGLHKDAAFRLAKQTKDLRDRDYAESLAVAGADHPSEADDPDWRWENLLGEWVQKTPARPGAKTAKELAPAAQLKTRPRLSLPAELEDNRPKEGQGWLQLTARRPPRYSLPVYDRPPSTPEMGSFRPLGFRARKDGEEKRSRKTLMLLTDLAGSDDDVDDIW